MTEISETDMGDGYVVSELELLDENENEYSVVYLGYLENVYNDDVVMAYGLPLTMSDYLGESGFVDYPILAGSYIEKLN